MKEKFIGVFLALVGLTIILIKEDLDTTFIKFVLIIQLFVLIFGFWGKSFIQKIKGYHKKRKLDKFAMNHFDKTLWLSLIECVASRTFPFCSEERIYCPVNHLSNYRRQWAVCSGIPHRQ